MIKLLVLDLDETVVKNDMPFQEVRKRVRDKMGIKTNPRDFYEYLKKKGPEYIDALKKEEINRAKTAHPAPGLDELIRFCKEKGVRMAILTRNCREATYLALGKYASEFDEIITRDDGFHPKPNPEAIVYLMKKYGATPEETIVVGDYEYDIIAGKRAGCITVRVGNGDGDYRVENLRDLIKILETFE